MELQNQCKALSSFFFFCWEKVILIRITVSISEFSVDKLNQSTVYSFIHTLKVGFHCKYSLLEFNQHQQSFTYDIQKSFLNG